MECTWQPIVIDHICFKREIKWLVQVLTGCKHDACGEKKPTKKQAILVFYTDFILSIEKAF